MNFDDTPQEAAFRAEARAWIAANAPKQYEDELAKSSLGRLVLSGANVLEVAKAWQKKKADAARQIKLFPDSDIKILNGRYGPYVTDGKRNARVPKDTEPASLGLEECQTLLDNAPAKRGGARRGRARKS